MSEITPAGALRMAAALDEYDACADDLKALCKSYDDPALVRAAERWVKAAREVNRARTQVEKEHGARELLAQQEDIVEQNRRWLARNHPDRFAVASRDKLPNAEDR